MILFLVFLQYFPGCGGVIQMTKNITEYGNIENELVQLFDRLQAELPPDVASLEVTHLKPGGPGIFVKLKPQNPDAASVWAHAENFLPLIDFGFGDWGTTRELPIEGDNPGAGKSELLEEVYVLSKAVMAGNCRHKRGFLSISGSVQVGDRTYTVTDWLVFWPSPPLHGIRTYKPYTPGPRDQHSSTSSANSR